MIEYYTFKHPGVEEKYRDEVFLTLGEHTTIAIFNGSKLGSSSETARKLFVDILSGKNAQDNFDSMSQDIENAIPENAEYMALRIDDAWINSIRRGGVLAKIVKNGELKVLPNGVFGLENDDRIVCATEAFFNYIPDEGILASALTAESCEEWMSFLVQRISDINELKCENLSCVTLIVRSED